MTDLDDAVQLARRKKQREQIRSEMRAETAAEYPDLEPDGLGDVELRRAAKSRAPDIAWGKKYLSWPIEWQLVYAEDLASSMNEAARKLQIERNRLAEICKQQEAMIKQLQSHANNQNRFMQTEIGRANEERNASANEVRKLRADLVALERTIDDLERGTVGA